MCFVEEGGYVKCICLDTMNIAEKKYYIDFNYYWLCLQIFKTKLDVISKGKSVRFPLARCKFS